jgi:hypothetical protein
MIIVMKERFGKALKFIGIALGINALYYHASTSGSGNAIEEAYMGFVFFLVWYSPFYLLAWVTTGDEETIPYLRKMLGEKGDETRNGEYTKFTNIFALCVLILFLGSAFGLR